METKEKVFRFELTLTDINVIGKALGELSYKESAPILNRLQISINEQVASENKEKEVPETKSE